MATINTANHPPPASGLTVRIYATATLIAIAMVAFGVVMLGIAAKSEPPLLPDAGPGHRPVIAHKEGYAGCQY